MRSTFLLLVALSLVGCSLGAKLPEGRIRCEAPSDCPSTWVCRVMESESSGLCYRTAVNDAGSQDSSTPADSGRDSAAGDSAVLADSGMDGSTFEDGGSGVDASTDASAEAGPDADTDADTPMTDAGGDAATPDSGGPSPDASLGPPPSINAVVVPNRYLTPGLQTSVSCLAVDPASLPLTYTWSASTGSFQNPMQALTSYTAADLGVSTLTCNVRNTRGASDEASESLRVYPSGWLTLLRFSLDSNDRSGNNNNGILTNGTYDSDRAGNTGASISLSGDGDVTLPNESMFDLDAWSFVVTVRSTAGHGGTLVSKGQSAFGAFAILLYPDTDASLPGRLQYFQGGTSTYTAVLGSYAARANRFFQLAVTRSASGELRTYVDGTLFETHTNVPEAEHNDAPVVFGNGPLGAFTGVLDEIQIYNRALSASEVMALTAMQ